MEGARFSGENFWEKPGNPAETTSNASESDRMCLVQSGVGHGRSGAAPRVRQRGQSPACTLFGEAPGGSGAALTWRRPGAHRAATALPRASCCPLRRTRRCRIVIGFTPKDVTWRPKVSVHWCLVGTDTIVYETLLFQYACPHRHISAALPRHAFRPLLPKPPLFQTQVAHRPASRRALRHRSPALRP